MAIGVVSGVGGTPALYTSEHTDKFGDYTQSPEKSVSGSVSRR
jgi:hypothetical protein